MYMLMISATQKLICSHWIGKYEDAFQPQQQQTCEKCVG